MRQVIILLASGMLATGLLAGCSDNNNPTGPSNGGGNGGGTSGGGTGSRPPATASVTLGDISSRATRTGRATRR